MASAPSHRVLAVLDNEAAQAIADVSHPKHRRLAAILEAVDGRNARRPSGAQVVVPTTVRVEVLLARRAASKAGLGRFRVRDVTLTSDRADRAVALRALAGGSTVDAAVMQVAEELATDRVKVTVYTADLADLPRLAAATRTKDISVRLV